MRTKHLPASQARRGVVLACLLITGQLTGCGGGDSPGSTDGPSLVASAEITYVVETAPGEHLAPDSTTVHPTYQLAPVLLPEPDGVAQSVSTEPHLQVIPPGHLSLPNERLTAQRLREFGLQGAAEATSPNTVERKAALASGAAVVTYTPAQIRQAYGFPALPVSTSGLSAAQAADLGAGQTIYIIAARHNPNVAAELAAFNTKFGLPACTTKVITAVPAPAPASSCEVSVVYATSAGTLTTTPPAYDAGWATEIALDVQWAHATAPLARLVVVEATDPSLNALLGAINLANKMGPGIVSMSLGTNEGSWTSSVEAAFSATNMTYLAATGDSGAAVSWPAVSPKVLAVGGTSLTYSAGSPRVETAWSGTGGGVSAYTPVPTYQSATVPGMGTQTKRSVGDVSFNANPSTGQYVATIAAGSTTVSWVSAGGTSLATPQWAGLMAVANAKRTQAGKSLMGTPHALIYGQIATNASTYAAAFKDITSGSNGACATCVAKTAYDPPTGMGTPNASALAGALAGASVVVPPPVVTAATVTGQAGLALTFTASASGTNALAYSLAGAPAGMTIQASTGVVSWSTPIAGTYAVTVSAKDTVTNLSGSATYTVQITSPVAPVGTDTTVAGTANVALTFQATFKASNPLTFSMAGAPSGMVINASTGVVSWPTPVVGTYTIKITAKDTKTGLTGLATYTVKVQSAPTLGPVITANPIAGVAGKPISGLISISDPGATALQIAVTGVPLGMGFSISGTTITASWPSPVAGNYTLTIKVMDNLGRSATATLPISITK